MAGFIEIMQNSSDEDLIKIASVYPEELRKFCMLITLEYQLLIQSIDDRKRTDSN